MTKGINARHARGFNRRLVLSTVRSEEPVSRAEISRLTGLAAPTVGRIVQQLIEEGLVSELGRLSRGIGQPPIALGIHRRAAHTVGLHLDHDVITGVVLDLGGAVAARAKRRIDHPSPEQGLRLLADTYHQLAREAGDDAGRLLGVGLVSVGPLDVRRGRVLRAPYFADWSDVPLRDELAGIVGQDVTFDNNATAAAIGEHFFGAAQDVRDFLYVYLGYGIGGGIFADGHVHRGASLNAGEFGHMIVEPGGLTCSCGSRGCLETVASGYALRRDLGPGADDPGRVDCRLREGEPEITAWVDRAAGALSHAVVGAHNLLDVDTVVLGGNLPGEVMRRLHACAAEAVTLSATRSRRRSPRVELGELGEDAAALGAATLPMYEAFVPVPAHVRRRGPAATPAGEGVIG